MTLGLAGLSRADFQGSCGAGDVWADPVRHVDGLHGDLVDRIVAEFRARTRAARAPAVGQTVTGPVGSGKTHIISNLRRRVWGEGGWFIRLEACAVGDFWEAAAHSFVDSLLRPMKGGATQASALMRTVLKQFSQEPAARKALAGKSAAGLTKTGAVDLLLAMLEAVAPVETEKHRDVVRAVALLEARGLGTSALASRWLQGDAFDMEDLHRLGFREAPPPAAHVVRGLMYLLSLGGPTLIVIDEIDSLANEAGTGAPAANAALQAAVEGIMTLQGAACRSMTLVSCLTATWASLVQRAPVSLVGRFREARSLPPMLHATLVERLIEERLAPAYSEAKFNPPYPTYPFSRTAIESALGLSPREILLRCRRHQTHCLAEGEIVECLTFNAQHRPTPAVWPNRFEMEAWDKAFAKARRDGPPPRVDEGTATAGLLAGVCELYRLQEEPTDAIDWEIEGASPGPEPALHAALASVRRDDGVRRRRWGFRVVEDAGGLPFAARLKALTLSAALGAGFGGGHPVILRAAPAPVESAAALRAFLGAGGLLLAPEPEDFVVFTALKRLADASEAGFVAWLRRRKPLLETKLFQSLGLAALDVRPEPEVRPALATPSAVQAPPAKPHNAPAPRGDIVLGRSAERGAMVGPVTLPLDRLSKHIAIFAEGAKSSPLRRLIEEAAIIGVPVVALDAGNNLTRLGEPWPSRPTEFSDEDSRRARAYFEQVEVVIWTPGVDAGRPIRLNQLPNFGAVGQGHDAESVEDRERAIEMAVVTLEPHLIGSGSKAIKLRGVLVDSLRRFARTGGGSFDDYLGLLANFPTDVSRVAEAPELAKDLVGQLLAAAATDPLLGLDRAPMDFGGFFEGQLGKTRVSIISLGGLSEHATRTTFVHLFQTALYDWIKTNPSSTGRLYVIDDAHAYAPLRETAVSKRSALALFKNAQKYGLALVAATCKPESLDPTIAGSCATHIYGRLDAPESMQAAEAMATRRSGANVDLGLKADEVYFITEGLPRAVRVRVPLSLSRRAQKPPSAAEIVAMARRDL